MPHIFHASNNRHSWPLPKRLAMPLVLVASAVLAAECSTSPGPSAASRTTITAAVPTTTVTEASTTTAAPPPFYAVTTGYVAGLGTILVDGEGLTLYMFEPDRQSGKSACYGECENLWPPVVLVDGVKAPDRRGWRESVPSRHHGAYR